MSKGALICGATGIVGKYLVEALAKPDHPEGPWKVYAVGRRPHSAAKSCIRTSNYTYVQCELRNRDETYQQLSPLKDITHIFWVTWGVGTTEVENCEINRSMFSNTLDAVVPNAPDLKHICLQTGAKEYLGTFKQIAQISSGTFVPRDPPFTEDMPRLPGPNFYHTLEDLLIETVKKSAGRLTYSIHRPTFIIGFSTAGVLNALVSICIYGAICRKQGLPFMFPCSAHTWKKLSDMATGDLVAEQEIWAATDPRAHGQAFNCTNGDVYTWKMIWPVIAKALGVEEVPYKGEQFSLTQKLKDMGPVWDDIVEEHNLIPTKLHEVANFAFVDGMSYLELSNISSTNKRREFGFHSYRNSVKAVETVIKELIESRLIPDPASLA